MIDRTDPDRRMSGEELKADLRPWGYAPGHYSFRCMDCPEPTSFEGYAQGDKRSIRCEKHALEARDAMFTPEQIAAANAKTDRLSCELDITNADHIALWLEANMADSSLAWLACRIVEAHEAAIRAHPLPEQPQEVDAAAEIASLKQRLESAEGLLTQWRTWACGQEGASPFQDTRTFLQEQEKQNG